MSENILIVEDEERIRKLIGTYFLKEGCQVLEANNGVEALKMFKEKDINLIVLDIMMPYMNGFEVCKSIRKIDTNVPIIILTAKSEEDDKLLGYELGADDYVTKPFSPKVLLAKAKVLLKRDKIKQRNLLKLEIDGLEIDDASHEVKVEGRYINLSPKEYDLLLFFVENKGLALNRDKILDGVWGLDYYGDLRTVDTHVKRLREKLEEKSYLISTVRGSGYKFEVRR